MATTVHIPDPLLKRVDARARARGVSRNRVIVEALESSLGPTGAWPPELVQMLKTPLRQDEAAPLEVALAAVRKRRRSPRRRRAPEL